MSAPLKYDRKNKTQDFLKKPFTQSLKLRAKGLGVQNDFNLAIDLLTIRWIGSPYPHQYTKGQILHSHLSYPRLHQQSLQFLGR